MKLPQTVPHLFRNTQKEWLEGAQRTAQNLLFSRDNITIMDVLRVYPLPSYLKRNILGQVFKNDIFKPIGYTRSTAGSAHGHVIRMWTLESAYFPESMLAHRQRNVEEYGE